MSENTMSDTGGADQIALAEVTKETHLEYSPPADATADELYDSFMDIANDPQLQKIETLYQGGTDGTLDQGETTGSSDPGEQVDLQVKENNTCVDEQTGLEVPDQLVTEATQPSNPSEMKSIDNDGTHEKTNSPGSGDFTEESVAVDGETLQKATDLPTEQVMSNPVNDESKSEELPATITSGDLQTSIRSVTANEDERTKGLSPEMQSSEKSFEDQEKMAGAVNDLPADSKVQSIDNASDSDSKEFPPEKSDESNKDPDEQKTDVAQRLSEAMENLAGLEQLLSSAVSEFKVSNNENKVDESDQKNEVNTITKDGQKVEEEKVEQDTSGSLDVEKNEMNVHDVSQNSEEVIEPGNGGVIDKTPQLTELLSEVTVASGDLNNEGTLLNIDEISADDNSKDTVDSISDDSKEREANMSAVQEDKMENAIGSVEVEKQEMTADKDLQVQNNVSVTDECPGTQKQVSQDDSKVQTDTEDSTTLTPNDALENVTEVSLKTSNSADDNKVANAGMPVPGIEITMTDESGISEDKSVDSVDTEGEGDQNDHPISPLVSDEGIDSDAASDYGDDEEVVSSDPENSSSLTREKSWQLEINRDRLSSDSSTVSEKDFKDSYGKGDGADGKSVKEDYIRGHLLKMGGTGLTPKNWRKRWCVVRADNCLYYYKNSKDKVPCGVIILSNYSVSKAPEINKNYCFKLTKGGARTYYMCAGSDSDMKKWMMAMMDASKVSSTDSNPFNILEGNVHNVSIPALSIRDPDCHGYMYKQGSYYKIWRRRYFVLKNGFLYYYNDMSNTVALGVVKLLNYTINIGDQNGKKFFFSATSPDKSTRTYHFYAESEMDRTRWLSRLKDSIKKGSSVH